MLGFHAINETCDYKVSKKPRLEDHILKRHSQILSKSELEYLTAKRITEKGEIGKRKKKRTIKKGSDESWGWEILILTVRLRQLQIEIHFSYSFRKRAYLYIYIYLEVFSIRF